MRRCEIEYGVYLVTETYDGHPERVFFTTLYEEPEPDDLYGHLFEANPGIEYTNFDHIEVVKQFHIISAEQK